MGRNERYLVGLAGHESDFHLIRYTALVARTHARISSVEQRTSLFASHPTLSPLGGQTADGNLSMVATVQETHAVGADPEVRFVYVVPPVRGMNEVACGVRARLRKQVQESFADLAHRIPATCDVLHGCPDQRLAAFAREFESDAILVSQAACTPRSARRLAMSASCPVWLVPPAWAPVIRNLLVPIDFSEQSLDCLRVAIDLARHSHCASCLALHVYFNDALMTTETNDMQIRRRLATAWESFISGVDRTGIRVQPLFVESPRVDDVIRRVAEQRAIDLIVMSTRGRTALASLVLPSVTEQTVQGIPVAVLVLKQQANPIGFFRAVGKKLARPVDVHFR